MTPTIINDQDLPGLYQAADGASLRAQSIYFWGLGVYLVLLLCAALVSFTWPTNILGALTSAALFLLTLGILIGLKVKKPDDIWYNGRAVAESVKTRSWRWMMQAEPYQDVGSHEITSKQFISDLKSILIQNRSLSHELTSSTSVLDPISTKMNAVRQLSLPERLEIYQEQRINNQANWYSKKSIFNKKRAFQWFCASVILHAIAIIMLFYRITEPTASVPVEVIATAAGTVLTWLQAKKHGELNSSYGLAAHEIVLIKGEALSVKCEKEFSEFVINSESAFSREHTQWTARKSD
ncbi:DUF4231 domain-containing protein [Methylovulum psychrotolerans]|uniref:DUF4231 domain-containing protein n=1 Tax=Methylovulum psychrotolerans TaxID=1704499 RepID=A0A2S5CFZ8_9GAMM|nr:DUF4231 domain-containing protein [Methylovulum psychrotolerans]POZ49687.1 hypothetical protein AADEFJLK_04532 [Methylovulum psychrotolerans]